MGVHPGPGRLNTRDVLTRLQRGDAVWKSSVPERAWPPSSRNGGSSRSMWR